MFIDKYTQIPRIINPIILTIEEVDKLAMDENINKYIKSTFGGTENLKKSILADFFCFGFDGSRADNFFDGSCIDGRLTSAWNWCSKLEKSLFFQYLNLLVSMVSMV